MQRRSALANLVLLLSISQIVFWMSAVWAGWSRDVIEDSGGVRFAVLGGLFLSVLNLPCVLRLGARGVTTKRPEWLPLIVGAVALVLTPFGAILTFLPLIGLFGS